MDLIGKIERFAECVTADPSAMDVTEISDAIDRVLEVQSVLDHALVRLSAAADLLARDPAAPRGPGGESLLRRSRLTNHHAAKIARRAGVLSSFPMFDHALAHGEVRGEHLDVLGAVLRDVEEVKRPAFTDPFVADALLDLARKQSPTELAREARAAARIIDQQAGETEAARIRRERRLKFTRHHDGTVSVHGNLGADGAEIRRTIETEAARLRAAEKTLPPEERSTVEQLNADALTSLIRGGASHGGVVAPVNPTCIVQLTLDDLVDLFQKQRTHATTSDGVPLTAEYAWSLLPTATIVPVLLDQSGLPIELAKAARQRLATMIQRAVLAAMYDTCIVPDCDTPFDDCEIHHLADYDGKNTALANLGPVCKHDHCDHHAGRRIIHLDADRTVTVTLPDGTIHAHQEYRPPRREPPPA